MRRGRYIPRFGSVPARAICWLHSQPPGTEVTTDVLAEAAGFVRRNATAFLSPAVDGQALSRRSSNPNNPKAQTLWSLGPDAPTAEEITSAAAPKTVQVQATAAPMAPRRSIFEARAEQKREAMEAPVPLPGSFMAEWHRLRGGGA